MDVIKKEQYKGYICLNSRTQAVTCSLLMNAIIIETHNNNLIFA